jgi:DNA invertase Pin-like site-specific DNA recombinase
MSAPSGPHDAPVPVIGYVRVSMKREEMISPQTQKAAIRAAARRRGRKVIDWIEDLDKTGRNFKRRIMEAIGRVEAGDVREIIVWKYSRFGRDRVGVAVNLARLEKAGGQLTSATEDVDARTATGKFTRGMLFEVAAFESDRAGETWHEAYLHRVAAGLPPLGRPRFGYRRLGRVRDEEDPHRTRRDKADPEDERYVPDPDLGPVLAGMYRACTAGDGGKVIAGRLNRQAIPNAYDRPWSGRTVLDVLDSGFGAGYLRLHNPSCPCGNGTRCKERVFARGRHEPVIEEEEWQAYLRRRAPAAAIPPRHRNPAYPVSGLVQCGHCRGAIVTSGARTHGDPRWVCSRQRHYGDCPGAPAVQLSALLDAVRAELAKYAADIDARAAVAKARRSTARTARGEAGRLGRELAETDRKLTNLAMARAAAPPGQLPDSAWEDAAATLSAGRAELSERLAAASRQASAVSADPQPVITGILSRWDTLPAAALNQMLRTVIRHVTVWRTGPPARDARGHFLPSPVRIRVIPVWETGEEEPSTL